MLEQNLEPISNFFGQIKIATDKNIIKTLITAAVNNLTSIAIQTASDARSKSQLKTHPKAKLWYEKKKSWWCDTLTKLHNSLTNKYKQYHQSNFKSEFKKEFIEAKKAFRIRKRLNLKCKRDCEKREKFQTH